MSYAIAHPAKGNTDHQRLKDHLLEVGKIAGRLASKIGLEKAGTLVGTLHDLGKYSQPFQDYMQLIIQEQNSHSNPDTDEESSTNLKGRIDHSTAGAQWIFFRLKQLSKELYPDNSVIEQRFAIVAAQILSICIASHHSGLIDNLKSEISSGFLMRLHKDHSKTHLEECIECVDDEIKSELESLANLELLKELVSDLQNIYPSVSNYEKDIVADFNLGFYTRFLFSCLIDADRVNSADFETPFFSKIRNIRPDWELLCGRMDSFINELDVTSQINIIRKEISENCYKRAYDTRGLYSLTVPTGGGKTLSSMRFALHHAKVHKLDHIFYIIPYTSIIEQNALAVRNVLERKEDQQPSVLELHSSLEPEIQTWESKIISENWDAPIIFTTMVQFLETLFAGGTRGARRLHQLANSVVVFDEIQTLPVNCIHLFNNALNFLVEKCGTTAVMCTATQPLLHKVYNPEKGCLKLSSTSEIVPAVRELFDQLRRVEIIDLTKPVGWSLDEICQLAMEQIEEKLSCLIIVNTKRWARDLFQSFSSNPTIPLEALFHLSTSMCAAHRKTILAQIKQRLQKDLPVLCVSTQMIEAGVDIDFASVIRFQAGLDSIAQAGGRCNRNGNRPLSQVYVVNPAQESISSLTSIKVGRDISKRILHECEGQDLLSPEVMEKFFKYYFFDRSDEMIYPVKDRSTGGYNSILNWLSSNDNNPYTEPHLPLKQAFMTAGKAFKVIDAPNQSLLVPYAGGKEIITKLCATNSVFYPGQYFDLLRKSQQFSVNLFQNTWKELESIHAIHETRAETGVFYLDERFYSEFFGVSVKPCSCFDVLMG